MVLQLDTVTLRGLLALFTAMEDLQEKDHKLEFHRHQ